MFGILQVVKIFGEKSQNLNAIIGFCIALFLTFADKPRLIVNGMIPWFALMFVFGLFLLTAMRFIFGSEAGDSMLLSMLGGKTGAGWWVGVGAIIILIVGISSVIGDPLADSGENATTDASTGNSDGSSGSTATDDYRTNVLNTLYHPKLLGAVVLLLIALFAILLITRTARV